jgi:SAM-dependent methyltransferase
LLKAHDIIVSDLLKSAKGFVINTPLEPVARKIHAAVKGFLFKAKCYPMVRARLTGKCGVEIGGPSYVFDTNLPIYRHIQSLDNCVFAVETHWEGQRASGATFKFDRGKRTGNNFITEGSTLEGISDATYDFVLSSHNLEHIANPIKALQNWKRVLKPQGFLLVSLPDKHRTFDYLRPVTTLDHLREDYARDMGEQDMTHVEELVTLWDYKKFPIANSIAEHWDRYRDNYHQRLVHHHVFDLQSAVRLIDFAGFELLSKERCRPNHLILFAQKR